MNGAVESSWADFPRTEWSIITGPEERDAEKRRRAWEHLAEEYWLPVYSYVRAKWGKSREESSDLAQDFFLWMMETGFIGQADRERGTFRAFIKTTLHHYLCADLKKQRTVKRGGEVKAVNLEELPLKAPDLQGRTPEQVLDVAWRDQLLSRASELLEERYRGEGKETYFFLFRDFYLGRESDVQYATLGEKYGTTPAQISNYLQHAKHRFRETLRELVAEIVRNPEELEVEYAELFEKDSS